MLSCNARSVLSCVAAGHINVKGMHVHVLVDVQQKLAASVGIAVPERRPSQRCVLTGAAAVLPSTASAHHRAGAR